MSLLGKYLADRDSEDLKKVFLWVLIISTIILTIFLIFYYGRASRNDRLEKERLKAEIAEMEKDTGKSGVEGIKSGKDGKDKSKNKKKRKRGSLFGIYRSDKDDDLEDEETKGIGYVKNVEDGRKNGSGAVSGASLGDNSDSDLGVGSGAGSNSCSSTGSGSGVGSGAGSSADSKSPANISSDSSNAEELNLKDEVPYNAEELILKDIKTLRKRTVENVESYAGGETNNYSLKTTVELNIEKRKKYIEYIEKNGLPSSLIQILKSDNEKDNELLGSLATFDRNQVKGFSYWY